MWLRSILFSVFMLLLNCSGISHSKEPSVLRIFSSSNVMGYIKPCG